MKVILSERNIVVVLFVMVLVTFSLAQEDSKKMEKVYMSAASASATHIIAEQPTNKASIQPADFKSQ